MSGIVYSVIMPVYNAGKYITETLDSFCLNDISNFELICIDDCSQDNSLEILEGYKSKIQNIKVIRLEKNGGVSNARNIGLNKAKGDYVLFLDSDDFFASTFFEYLNNLEFLSDDLMIFKHLNTNHRLEQSEIKFTGKYKEISIEECIDILIGLQTSHDENLRLSSVWGKVFKREIIESNNLYFNKNLKIGEDSIFLLQYFSYVRDVKIYDELAYYYYNNPASLTHSFQKDMILNDKTWQLTFQEFLQSIPESKISKHKLIEYRDYSLAKGILNICYLYIGHKESNFSYKEIVYELNSLFSISPYSTYNFNNMNSFFKKDKIILKLIEQGLFNILGIVFLVKNKLR